MPPVPPWSLRTCRRKGGARARERYARDPIGRLARSARWLIGSGDVVRDGWRTRYGATAGRPASQARRGARQVAGPSGYASAARTRRPRRDERVIVVQQRVADDLPEHLARTIW